MVHERKLVFIVVGAFLCMCIFIDVRTIPNDPPPIGDLTVVLSKSLGPESYSWYNPFPLDNLPPNDSSQLIDINDFEFLINPPCSESPYLVLVHSAPTNYAKRQLIRNTWGARLPLYFFFGETSPYNQSQLDTESAEFHDLVQGSFVDSYRNLTYKHAMVFKWVIYSCPRIRYILKIDDDVFVNVANLEELLTRTLSPYGTRDLLMCSEIWYDEIALRSYRSKWRVSFSEYANPIYPPHCKGASLLYSPDVIFKLYQKLQEDRKYFWVDDVFITGVLVSNLNLTHAKFDWWPKHHKSFLKVYTRYELTRYDPRKDLFALIYDPNFLEKFNYLYNKTYSQGGHNSSSVDTTYRVSVKSFPTLSNSKAT